uniref:Uncharacterized protein n=1 Tax=Opuntia streptacantha TaxID=393608 RepID=A0A7C8Z191_OPUST
MSIALDNNRIERVSGGGFLGRSKMAPCNLPILDPEDRGLVRVLVKEEREDGSLDHCSSASSSIGKNSDEEGGGGDENDEDEVQSKLKSSTFDSAVDALEQALPISKGISKFYNGKSKSFASLADAACSSIKDITKPENAYTRKRKNLLSYSLLYEKGRFPLPRSPGFPKRSMKSSLSSVALGMSMSNDDGSVEENGSSPETDSRNSSLSPPRSPPHLPPWRSFSVADLQHCAATASAMNSPSLSSHPLMGKRNKHDEVS